MRRSWKDRENERDLEGDFTKPEMNARDRLREVGEHFCKVFIDGLDIPTEAKVDKFEQCSTNWRKMVVEQKISLIKEVLEKSGGNWGAVPKVLGYKLLNPKIDPPRFTKETVENLAKCEEASIHAPDEKTEKDFKNWCISQIPFKPSSPKYYDDSEREDGLDEGGSSEGDPLSEMQKFVERRVPEYFRAKKDDVRGSDQVTDALVPPQEEFKSKVSEATTETTFASPTELAFHTPRKVVRRTSTVENGLAQEAPYSTPIYTITRKFGVKPLDKTKIVTPRIFGRFEKIVNRMIRVGASFPDSLFEREGLLATKDFYDEVRKTPSMDALWQQHKENPSPLNERAWRCAAQPAYFSLRNHKTQVRLLRYLIGILHPLPNLTMFFASDFPQREVFDAVYAELYHSGMKLTKGQFSRVHLGNTLRWMRNLLKRGFRTKYMQVVADTFNTLPNPPHLANEMACWFTRDMTKFLKSYLRILSGRMTWLVKRVLNSSRRTLPSSGSGLGSLIAKVLARNELSIKNLGIKDWKKVRTQWRNDTLQALQRNLGGIDVGALANYAVKEARAGLLLARIVKLLFNFRPGRMRLGAGNLTEFKAFLVKRAITEIEHRLITFLKPRLVPTIQQALTTLQGASRGWVHLPHFKKQSIPFGMDDRRVYIDADLQDLYILALHKQGVTIEEIVQKLIKRLPKQWRESPKIVAKNRERVEELIKFDEETLWFEKIKKQKEPIRLHFRLEKGNPMWFELKTPKRFLRLVQAGYAPQKATLLKKTGGGLILALPFEKEVPKSQCLEQSDLTQMQDPLITAGLDPGLKTLAVLSIGEGDQLATGAWGQAGREIARYFIGQKELLGKRSDWFKSSANKAAPVNPKKGKDPNFKGRLVTLQRAASARQAERDDYRNALRKRGINHRHAQKFFDLNRNVKHIWRNINNLHEALARQVATRVIAACEHHRVRVLRMEDLRWAKHARKQKVGYFLATWQIHWFFSQIQECIADLAPRKGIFVEWVVAKHTSKRCSRCGQLGDRKGKIFNCPHCGFQLDSDLNAARNIRVAPRSDIPPSLYALAGGSPSLPPEDESVLGLS